MSACNKTTVYHQIKDNSLRFSQIVFNCIKDFMIVFLKAALATIKIIFASFEKNAYRFERTILKIHIL